MERPLEEGFGRRPRASPARFGETERAVGGHLAEQIARLGSLERATRVIARFVGARTEGERFCETRLIPGKRETDLRRLEPRRRRAQELEPLFSLARREFRVTAHRLAHRQDV